MTERMMALLALGLLTAACAPQDRSMNSRNMGAGASATAPAAAGAGSGTSSGFVDRNPMTPPPGGGSQSNPFVNDNRNPGTEGTGNQGSATR